MKKSIIASYALLILFLITALIQINMEFLIYAGILLPIVVFLHLTDKRFSYHPVALWGFAVWILLHIIGGLVPVNGEMTYNLVLINIIGEPYSILKYDQVVHFYCYVVMAMLVASIVTTIIKKNASPFIVGVIIVLAATGIGGINEIIEFAPVVLFDSPGPGGYINTAIDLVMNLLGAIAGVLAARKLKIF